MSGFPFSGIKVLDVSQGVAGPHAGMLLAQNGAEVIKLEPMDGDWGRTLGKRYGEFCAQAVSFNRGKQSIALNLKSEGGQTVAKRLAERADIFIESFRPGVAARLGFGYDDLRTLRADIIYLSISGFGQKGEYRDLRVTDAVIQAFSGWMTLHRDGDGTPMRSDITAIDVLTGLYAYQAIASAFIERLRNGNGAHIDCSMMQAAAAFQSAKIIEAYMEDGRPQVSYVPVGVMPTSDGYIAISAMRDAHYAALCEQLGRPDMATDPRFATRDARREHKEVLMPMLAAEFRKQTTAHWSGRLSAAGVMNSAVNTYLDFLADPHVKSSGILPHAEVFEGTIAPTVNVPGCVPLSSGDPRGRCPAVGEHTDDILERVGIEPDERRRLRRSGAVR
ncbi:CoA transferase [Microbaculum marinum]|uniref:CoA transferase n=1 Tax=Microbaculum marinum TaxID=1764581 RepID=A0AAW9RRR8_9HYPH